MKKLLCFLFGHKESYRYLMIYSGKDIVKRQTFSACDRCGKSTLVEDKSYPEDQFIGFKGRWDNEIFKKTN